MSKIFKTLTLTTALIGSGLFIGQSVAMAQTLPEAVAQTLQTNPEILAEANRRLSVDKTIDQAKAGYLPQVDLDLGYGHEYTNNPATRPPGGRSLNRGEAGIAAKQMIYDGFYTKSEVDRTTSSAESAGYAVSDISESTSLQAVDAYLNILRRQELMAITQTNLDAHERIGDMIEKRAESGVGRRADVDQIQARLALSRANVVSEEGNIEDARSQYLRVVGNLPENITDPGDGCCDRAPATVDEAISVAINQHPYLRSALATHEASLAQVQGAKSAFHPKVDFDLSYRSDNNLNADGDNLLRNEGHQKELQAMTRLQQNLYNGGADSARVAQFESLSEQQKQQVIRAQRQIEQDVRLAWNALQTAQERVPKLKQRLEAAEKTRTAYEDQFGIGQRTLLDLLDSENELLIAGADYTEAYYNQLFACYWLAESMGQLLDALELQHREEAITVAGSTAEQEETTAADTVID
ncbi:Type I secretion outer membrane protein, TolC [Methylophaga frappieri]|jgi:adhesin transport system outer membrane protein|uniref:Type I secretion outer membrane protein, TolC n=1 Tax=Methylophaga frappieri (strain ATCC BAA-2434 / DSM 25690 / JAM7) TaxID=754477 RepID=I1YJT4_METFJ|nr:TolC family outer membrane protein [Methylophaga frappieri]AFJ03177.1 Type I secretion outer membrane protein, TolC [Methylophaga frappieri]